MRGVDPTPGYSRADDPSVSYFTLTELLGAELDDPEVVVAQRAIMDCGTVPAILAAQAADGHWGAVTTTMRPSTAAPPGSSSSSPRSVPTSACAAAARRSCPMHRTLSRAASPWPAPRRSEAACTAPSSPAFPATWSGVSSGCQKARLPAESDIVGAGRIPSWGGTGYWQRGNPTVSSTSVVFGQHGLAGAAPGTREARDIDIAGIGGEVIEAAQQPSQARRGEAGRALLLPE